jgi:hypothetical protein
MWSIFLLSFSQSIICSRVGLLPKGNIGFGIKKVYGCNLVPRPAAKITAFMSHNCFYIHAF